ncbi:MAG: hypothetical protein QOH79_2168 [Acidimicrobiaceae bacterium]
MRQLLQGIRVVEWAVLLNGGLAGALLGDVGADVIKVEDPVRGDYLRDMMGQIVPHHSPAHLQVNRQKRSLTIDLRSDEGKDVFWRLLDTADVFVDGYTAGVADRLGIGYDAQRGRRPGIVYCQHSGFGASGPYGEIPTHGFMQESLAAMTPMEVGPDGYPRHKEVEFAFAPAMARAGGSSVSGGALQCAFHVAAALVRRERTGEGCVIDISAAEAAIANAFPTVTYDLNDARITDRMGLPEGNVTATGPEASVRYQYYETADGKFILFCAIEPKFWTRFCEAVERPDLAVNTTEAVEWASGDVPLRKTVMEIFRSRSLDEWLALSAKWRLPIGPVYDRPTDLPHDAQLRSRQIFHEAEHPVAGPFSYVGSPAVIADQPYEVAHHAPQHGQHTAELLSELGYSPAEQQQLAERGVV